MGTEDQHHSTPEAPLRVPIAAAAERGVSWLTDLAAERRVVLTRYGRPAAAVDSAERLDESARIVAEARREVTDRVADMAAGRIGAWHALDPVCERLGIDPDRVRARAQDLAGAAPSDD